MKKAVKIWLITAAVLVVAGVGLMMAAVAAVGFDITKLSTVPFETNTYTVTEKFDNISVSDDDTDIEFVLSDDKKCRVECFAPEKTEHSVSVQNGTLTVKAADDSEWYDHFGISFNQPKITVYLPEKEYASLDVDSDNGNITIPGDFTFKSLRISDHTGNVKCAASVKGTLELQTSTGNIAVQDAVADTAVLKASTGNVKMENVEVKGGLEIVVSTGNIKLTNVIANGGFELTSSTGNINFDGCDASSITAKTSTGNITGTLLSSKIFSAQSHTGNINVPNTISGGVCDLKTETGNIKIEIK